MRRLVVAILASGLWSNAQTGIPTAIDLSLDRAIELALAPDGSTRLALAREAAAQAEARQSQARGYLLPNIDGAWTYSSFTRNLQAFGVSTASPIPGFGVPSFVGPIVNSDIRATASQAVFDLSAIRRYQGAKSNAAASRHEVEAARDQAVAAVAKAYIAAQRAAQAFRTAEANVALAQRSLRLAQSQKAAGTGTGIEVTRSEVMLASERQKLMQAAEDRHAAQLQLLRAIGMPLGTLVALTTEMKYSPADIPDAAAAVRSALESRPELKAQQERQRAARQNYEAARMERLPSVAAFGDYGNIGTEIGSGRATRTVGMQVKIPVFDGGRRDARREEGASVARQEAIRLRDVQAQVELEARLAVEALQSAENQTKVALEAQSQAEKEMAQAERRFQAGVAPGLEVTDAQTRLARARESYVNALFRQRTARIDLGLATGALDAALR